MAEPNSQFKLRQLVTRWDEGDAERGTGYVTSLKPLQVSIFTIPGEPGASWDHVELLQEQASNPAMNGTRTASAASTTHPGPDAVQESRPETDWRVLLLAGLSEVSASERPAECKKRRLQIRKAVMLLDGVLNESEEVVSLRPSKNDKLTAGRYHACFRQLHWALDRCRQLQEAAASLEDYDSDRLVSSSVSLEYALLSVDVVARHDHATNLLSLLCGPAQPPQRAIKKKKVDEDHPDGQRSAISDWLFMVVSACSSRVCMRGDTAAGSECTTVRSEEKDHGTHGAVPAPVACA